jgi:hypothetical protein
MAKLGLTFVVLLMMLAPDRTGQLDEVLARLNFIFDSNL